MVSLEDYVDREQSYVKHVFLEQYLEKLVHKIASKYSSIAYVDGFAGPWQSANEKFDDTSFGIALNALRRAKVSWKSKRDVQMSAFLVERDPAAYGRIASISERYPDVSIKTYPDDFLTIIPRILADIPSNAFVFFLIDPKGWKISLHKLQPLLARPNSEIVFNFMFDFIIRATGIDDPTIAADLDELMPYGDWRTRLDEAERQSPGGLSSDQRKEILVSAFSESLTRLGHYHYVAETTVLRRVSDRTLYCLFYGTRNPAGIEVFRDCQINALMEQSKVRAATKVERGELRTGQGEFFHSLHDMGPHELTDFLRGQKLDAERTILQITPRQPQHILYKELWPRVLVRHVVRLTEVNKIASDLRRQGQLQIPDWEKRKQVPQQNYRIQRP